MNRAFFLFLFFHISILFAQNTDRFDVINLSINSNENEFGTVLANDGSIFYLKSNFRNNTTYNEKSANLYKGALMSRGEFSSGRKFPTNATHAVFTNDGGTVYYSKKEGNNFQLFTAQIDRTGRWKNPTKLAFNNSSYTFKHPALNPENTKLFFASDMPGSYGKTDIYYVTINEPGRGFGQPIKLGANVNTSGIEIYPFIGKKDKLYFSSDNANSIGGLDIFESFYEKGKYVKTSNLGTPINSKKDDFAYILVTDTNKGYFSSNRTDGQGGVDIYYFKDRKPLLNKCSGIISGVIRNKFTKKVVFEASVEVFSPNDHMGTVLTNTKGEFSFDNIECEQRYDVVSYKEGFNGFAEVQTIPNDGRKLNLYLDPEHPEEFEEEFDFSNEMVVYNTQTKEVMFTEADAKKKENDGLSHAEKREMSRLEKKANKKKQIDQEIEAERAKKEKKEELRIAAIEEQKIAVEKEKEARLAHAKEVAENLRKEKEIAETADKERIEKEIIAQENARIEEIRTKEIAEENARNDEKEAERQAQLEKEKQLQAEADLLAKEEENKKQIEAEKQQELIAQKEAIEKDRQERIANAQVTAARLQKERELAEKENKQRIENEIIAQENARAEQLRTQEIAEEKAKNEEKEAERLAQLEEEKQQQAEADLLAKEEENKKQIEAEKQQQLIDQKNVIEKERQERIANAQATAARLQKERELAEKENKQRIEDEIIAEENVRAEQLLTQEIAEEKVRNDEKEIERLAQLEKEKQMQVEAELLAKEEKNKKQIEAKKQQELITQKEAIEKDRQERITNAQATAARLQKEREAIETAERQRIGNEIKVQENAKVESLRAQEVAEEKTRNEERETEGLAKLENEKQRQAEVDYLTREKESKERYEAIIAQRIETEKNRQVRIKEAQDTANQLKEKIEKAKNEEKQNQIALAKVKAERGYVERIIKQKEKQETSAKTEVAKETIIKEKALAQEKVNQIEKKIIELSKIKQQQEVVKKERQKQIVATTAIIGDLQLKQIEADEELLEIERITKVEVDNNKTLNPLAEETSDEIEANETIIQDNNITEQPKYQESERCSRNIYGVIQNSFNNKPIVNATIDIYYDGQNLESITTDDKGEFHFYNIDCNTRYTLIGFKRDFNNIAKADINTDKPLDKVILLLEPDPEPEPVVEIEEKVVETPVKVIKEPDKKEIVIQETVKPIITPETKLEIVPEAVNSGVEAPKVIGKKIQLNPIYFELDEWYLTLDARRELDKLIVLMYQNKTLIVESGSHTDTRGPFQYNLDLSENRSQEVVGYLVANGVDPDRISGRGYGETMPVNHCIDGVRCTDRQHIENRRTEFIILRQ